MLQILCLFKGHSNKYVSILPDHHSFDKHGSDEDFDKTKYLLVVLVKICPRQGYHLVVKAEKYGSSQTLNFQFIYI